MPKETPADPDEIEKLQRTILYGIVDGIFDRELIGKNLVWTGLKHTDTPQLRLKSCVNTINWIHNTAQF